MKIKEQDSQRMMISSSFLGLDDPISTKFVLDKLSQTITVERRYFWLIKREYIIPFSTVRSVRIDYKQKTVGGGLGGASKVDTWEIFVHLNKIAQSTNKAKMLRLASEISRFIGCELIDNSAKPESSFQRFLHRPIGKGFFRK